MCCNSAAYIATIFGIDLNSIRNGIIINDTVRVNLLQHVVSAQCIMSSLTFLMYGGAAYLLNSIVVKL